MQHDVITPHSPTFCDFGPDTVRVRARVANNYAISRSIASVTARPDIVLVAAGECLPLRENRVDVVEATCGAVERAATTTQGFHTRQQLQ